MLQSPPVVLNTGTYCLANLLDLCFFVLFLNSAALFHSSGYTVYTVKMFSNWNVCPEKVFKRSDEQVTLLPDSTDVTALQINFPISNTEEGNGSNLPHYLYLIWKEQLKICCISENLWERMIGLSKFLLLAHNITEGISADKIKQVLWKVTEFNKKEVCYYIFNYYSKDRKIFDQFFFVRINCICCNFLFYKLDYLKNVIFCYLNL